MKQYLVFYIFSNVTISNASYQLKASPDFSVQGLQARDNKNIEFIPANIRSTFDSLIAIRFQNCLISKIDSMNFDGLNLQYLDLCYNKIKSLDANTFSRLTALKDLRLNSNLITSLDNKIFSNLKALDTLSIGFNLIGKLHPKLLENLVNLKDLGINAIGLSKLAGDELKNNNKLVAILLQNINLNKINPKLFDNKPQLDVVNLQGNECINQVFKQNAITYSNFEVMKEKIQRDCTNGGDGKVAFGSVLMILICMTISGV
jgi:Leucine-rich repeat (LRR) protein